MNAAESAYIAPVTALTDMDEEPRIAALNGIRLALHRVSPFAAEPVDCVLWISAEQVEANGPHIIEARQCWDASESAREWQLARSEQGFFPSRPIPIEPPGVPWLAVWFGSALTSLPIDQIGMLGDFERCLAWTIIESEYHA